MLNKVTSIGFKGERSPQSPLLVSAPDICIWVLFFMHIPFVVNHTFKATPTERLQHYICQSILSKLVIDFKDNNLFDYIFPNFWK